VTPVSTGAQLLSRHDVGDNRDVRAIACGLASARGVAVEEEVACGRDLRPLCWRCRLCLRGVRVLRVESSFSGLARVPSVSV
jgi:hypothetical protein